MINWFPQAASTYIDMERGLYWTERGIKKKPNKDGTYPVVKRQILKDLGITVDYHDAKGRIWENPDFLKCLADERRRRDLGLACVTKEIEKVVGPLHETRAKVIENVKTIFERPPDAEDPEALSPKDYVSSALQWIKYIDETEGRTESAKQQTLENIMADMAQANRVSTEMMGSAFELLKQYRDEQDKKLGMLVEGEIVD